MLDIKILHATLDQLESEKMIPRARIIDAIEQSLAAAYKKDYGKKGQIVRATLDLETGEVSFLQVKRVVDETTVRPPLTEEEIAQLGESHTFDASPETEEETSEIRPRFDSEKHIYIEDARKIKAGVTLDEELVFPLESLEDFGRIAAQTAKQVIMQRIREAEKDSVFEEFQKHLGEIVSGVIQKVHRGMVIVDLGRVTGIIPKEEQIPGEYYKPGQRLKGYLYQVESTTRGISLKISRSHPRFIEALFAIESPEVAEGLVEIKSIAREAGSRSKIAVVSYDENIDPIGACVGQKGVRVNTVTSELSGEKIDIILWAEDPLEFVSNSLAPARVLDITLSEEEKIAHVDVAEDQLSLAIGKGGQNVRLAVKLTHWKIDINGIESADVENAEGDGFMSAEELSKVAGEEIANLVGSLDKESTSPETEEEPLEEFSTSEEDK